MKYNTLLVPVVAFAALASALPSDASASSHGYPSDQGKYKSRPKQLKEETPLEKLAGMPGQAKLPVNVMGSGLPPRPIDVSGAEGRLPIRPETAVDRLPFKPEDAPARLPIRPEGVPSRLPFKPEDAPSRLPFKPEDALARLPFKPQDAADRLPFHPEDAVARLPIRPDTRKNGVPVDGMPTGSLPVPNSLPTPGFLPKLPFDVPPKELPPKIPGMRRSRIHAVRAANDEVRCGRLVVVASDNKFSGFVSAARDEDGRHTVVKDHSKAVVVDLKSHNLVPRSIDTYDALGATFGVMHDKNTSEDNMQGNSANFAMLTGTSMTMYGHRDTDGSSSFNDATGASQKVESAIYYSGENSEVLASWVNTDGKAVPVQFGVNPDYEVVMGANVGQYAATYGGKSARVFCSEQ